LAMMDWKCSCCTELFFIYIDLGADLVIYCPFLNSFPHRTFLGGPNFADKLKCGKIFAMKQTFLRWIITVTPLSWPPEVLHPLCANIYIYMYNIWIYVYI
jgi:hypothetical protein